MSGTAWTAPGQGAELLQLAKAAGFKLLYEPSKADLANEMLAHLDAQAHTSEQDTDWEAKTNLSLTGAPLTPEDLERIAKCEVGEPGAFAGRAR